MARALCLVFALVGLLPVIAAALTRSGPVRDWAARESTRLLEQQLGIRAEYAVQISLWPLALELRDVTVHSSDGGLPALVAPRLTFSPRLFSLLAGHVDAGQISVEAPRLRLVVRDGKLQNLGLSLPSDGDGQAPRLPNASVAITDARLSAEIEGVTI